MMPLFKHRVIRLEHVSMRQRRERRHAIFHTFNPHGGSRPVSQSQSSDVTAHGGPEHRHYEPSEAQQRSRNQLLFGKNLTNRELEPTTEAERRAYKRETAKPRAEGFKG